MVCLPAFQKLQLRCQATGVGNISLLNHLLLGLHFAVANKNQHFVSQTYLRQFGIPVREGPPKAVNLFTVKSKEVISGASIKNQASRNYFYGKEKVFDDLLQHHENRYGAALSRMVRGEFSSEDVETLLEFTFLQYLRTPFQVEQRLRLIAGWNAMEIAGRQVGDAMPAVDRVHEAQHQLYIFAKEISIFSDLTPVILRNNTGIPIITSDNPSLCMNRLYNQRYKDITSGMIQSGHITLLPVSPRLAILAYDQDVYQPIGKDSTYVLNNENDVNRLNELQVIRAYNAIYFHNIEYKEYVRNIYYKYKSRRIEDWSIEWVGIRDGETEEFEIFRKLRPGDENSLEPRIHTTSPILPAPSTWPSFLKFRMRPMGWTNGSVVGFVRTAHIGRGRGFEYERLPERIPLDHAPEHREIIYQRKG